MDQLGMRVVVEGLRLVQPGARSVGPDGCARDAVMVCLPLGSEAAYLSAWEALKWAFARREVITWEGARWRVQGVCLCDDPPGERQRFRLEAWLESAD